MSENTNTNTDANQTAAAAAEPAVLIQAPRYQRTKYFTLGALLGGAAAGLGAWAVLRNKTATDVAIAAIESTATAAE